MSDYQHFERTKAYLKELKLFLQQEKERLKQAIQTGFKQPSNDNTEYKSFIADTNEAIIQKISDAETYLDSRLKLLEEERNKKKKAASDGLPSKQKKI